MCTIGGFGSGSEVNRWQERGMDGKPLSFPTMKHMICPLLIDRNATRRSVKVWNDEPRLASSDSSGCVTPAAIRPVFQSIRWRLGSFALLPSVPFESGVVTEPRRASNVPYPYFRGGGGESKAAGRKEGDSPEVPLYGRLDCRLQYGSPLRGRNDSPCDNYEPICCGSPPARVRLCLVVTSIR